MKSFTLLIFLSQLLIINLNVVYAQDPNCSTAFGSPCVKLNELLSPCNGKFSPPTNDSEYFPDANLAKCMCSQNAYNALSSCISLCFSNGNVNIKAANFVDYQKSCESFNYPFGPPTNAQSNSTLPRQVLIVIGVSVFAFILGCLFLWYWCIKKSKKRKKKDSEDFSNLTALTEQEMSAHQPLSEVVQEVPSNKQPSENKRPSISSTSVHSKHSKHSNHSIHSQSSISSSEIIIPITPTRTGLFPPPGTIQQHYPSNKPPQRPTYYVPYNPPPPTSRQSTSYVPQQPPYLQFQQPSVNVYPHPLPPTRNPYQYPHYNRPRSSSDPVFQNQPPPLPPPPSLSSTSLPSTSSIPPISISPTSSIPPSSLPPPPLPPPPPPPPYYNSNYNSNYNSSNDFYRGH